MAKKTTLSKLWTDEELTKYYTDKGFGPSQVKLFIYEYHNPGEPARFTPEETDTRNIVSLSKIDLNDRAFQRHQDYLRDRNLYNTRFLGGLALGIARLLPVSNVATDVTDAIGWTDKVGTGESELINYMPETSYGEYLGQGVSKTAKGMNPLQKGKNVIERQISKGLIHNIKPLMKVTKHAANIAKGFGLTDRISDGLQLVDYMRGYNPPNSADYK